MSTKNPKVSAAEKRDIAIVEFFVCVDRKDLDDIASEVETAKVCSCTVEQVREAVARVKDNCKHPYWKGKKL